MKNCFYFAAFLLMGIMISCGKTSHDDPQVNCSTVTTTAPADEVATLKRYLDSSAISVVQDNRGFFYVMDSTATTSATHATVCSTVAVTYKASFLNGTVFDSSINIAAIPLANVIAGWQEMLPMMKKKATVTLYLPPSLAYGTNGYPPTVPSNAYTIFTIQLYNFN